ncbi:hypothetical protein GCM10010495_27980 [Kitasatospora herbaricolor]|nr:hypothetical protein GCM10010495_27980 [Kitasatospora herbaricolor]
MRRAPASAGALLAVRGWETLAVRGRETRGRAVRPVRGRGFRGRGRTRAVEAGAVGAAGAESGDWGSSVEKLWIPDSISVYY